MPSTKADDGDPLDIIGIHDAATFPGLVVTCRVLDGREVIAVYEDAAAVKPSYLMWLEWTDGRISFIRDYRHVRYVVDDAELVLAAVERI